MYTRGGGFSGADRMVLVVCLILIRNLPLVPALARGASYDLDKVNGLAAFHGSMVVRELPGQNGLVVAHPAFKQIHASARI